MIGARRLPAVRGPLVNLVVDGVPVPAYGGETLAAALLAAGLQAFAYTRGARPRLPLCNMGTCFDCALTVDGVDLVRACLVPVADRMQVRTSRAW